MTTSLKLDATYATFIFIFLKPKNDDGKLWGVATTLATKKTNTKQWPFKLKNHKKVTTSLPLMEPTMEGCLLGSFKCSLKFIWLTQGQAKEEALGYSKVLHKGLKKHKKKLWWTSS